MASAEQTLAPRPPLSVVRTPRPGRVRLAVMGIRGSPARARAVREALAALDGVWDVASSAVTGHVLVEFDATVCSLEALLEAAGRALGGDGEAAPAPAHPAALGLHVRSAIPGRLRVRVAALHTRPACGPALQAAWSDLDGVEQVAMCAATSSALVRYDAARWEPEPLLCALAARLPA